MTMKPFLVINLEKAWREEQHPRDTFGKFTSVKSGSRVVTSTGKTGVVRKNTGEKVSIAYDGGGSGTLHRNNVLHENDHKKVEASKKKRARAQKAGQKQSATKAQQNADGTQKHVKQPTDPTKRTRKPKATAGTTQKTPQKPPTATKKAQGTNTPPTAKKAATRNPTPQKRVSTAKAKASQRVEVRTNYGTPKTIQKKPIPQKQNQNREKDNQAFETFRQYAGHDASIDAMWESPEVQRLLKKPAEKRSSEDIQRIAGQITEANKKLAFSVANKRADTMGFGVVQNRIGNVNAKNPIHQETGARFELIQSGLGAMYETLHKVLDGSENPRGSIGAHVTSRMKQKITKDLYGLLNSIPAPHDIRRAIGDMKREEAQLTQTLGRTPSDAELGAHLMKQSEAFKTSAIVKPARWDDVKGTWVATNKQEKDPEARLQALKRYASQQQTASMDKVVSGGDGDREMTLGDTAAVQDTARTPEERMMRKERQAELKDTLPKALKDMQLTDTQIELYTLKHAEPSATRNQPYRTDDEVAALYNQKYGTNYGGKWAYKHINAGRQLIAEAIKNNHPAIARLTMLKSFVFMEILKAIYEYDLVKSLAAWGMDHTALDTVFTRTAFGNSVYAIRKSLTPTEYIGSYSTTDTGHVRANIVEYRAPEPSELAKSFYAFSTDLRKSMFPHKGGTNHAVNQKAQAYVGKNKGKFKQIHQTQQQRIQAKQAKGGKLTWSEELAVKEKGFWISWGGKKILISGDEKSFGEVKYDSRNETHREEHNQGAQEDRIDFHHEDEALTHHRQGIEDAAHKDYHANGKTKSGNALRQWANKHKVAWDNESKTVKQNEDGTLQFDHGDDSHVVDHGIHAFNEELTSLHDHYHGKMKAQLREDHGHKATDHYTHMTDEERAAYDQLDNESKAAATGHHLLGKEGVTERLTQLQEELANAPKGEHKALAENALNDLKALNHGSRVLVNKNLMTGKGASLGGIAKDIMATDFGNEKHVADLAAKIGNGELSRSREEVGKNLLPEGKYTIGNPQTGKSLTVSVVHAHEGGRGGAGNQFTSVLKEAFDPQSGEHHTYEGAANSWGTLAKQLGFKNNVKFAEVANKGTDQPMIKQIDDTEFEEARKSTKAGLKDDMLHKEFKKVDEARNKAGEVTSRTYAQDMPDGTQNVFEIGQDGYVKDPIMRRLLNQREPIEDADQLHAALERAVGNTMWTTLHIGSDIHAGDALGHHVKLQYDGKGAPRVVGGTYDGYRFIDQSDVPKGAVDPHTGEPIKALFKNGKLINRRFTTKNDIPMEKGNAVMYPSGKGFRKGRIRDVQDGKIHVVDSKGHVVGVFSKNELKAAKADGKINAQNNQAVVRLAQKGVHRMDTSEVFAPQGEGTRAAQKAQKAKDLLSEALRKAKVNRALDDEGNVHKEIALSDAQHKRLQKVLGRSKAGRELMKQFNSAHTSELEIHVPEAMRATVEAEGVTVKKDGTATISTSKFEQLRDVLANAGNGVSLEQHARTYLNDHFRMKDRTKQSVDELKKKYQPSALASGRDILDEEYKKLFREDSFLRNPNAGLFSTQLEGIGHLVERKRAIAGHGMGTGKTILGVMSAMHYKATQMALGRKPKKTLIVAPKGILSDWGKEIGTHTNSKALYVGNFTGAKAHPEGGGKKVWGQAGTEQEVAKTKDFHKNMDKHASEDHDFHVMSYETFARMRDKLTASGMYDNIVIDEIHAFKNKGSNRGKSLAETTDKFKNVWGLSGTPMENDAREVYSLIDTVTGGRHELGTKAEFQENFMLKDKKGKITGIKPGMEERLGDIIANVVQFRHGKDVTQNDGSKIHFPTLVGSGGGNDNPHMDFIGNLADGSRDHHTNEYYGTKHSIVDFQEHELKPDGAEGHTVQAFTPKNLNAATKAMYSRYSELQNKYLPQSKLSELVTASATGYDRGKQDGSNYLTAMQKLQKYINAPLAEKMYVGEGGGNAIEAEITNAQGTSKAKGEGLKPFNPDTGEGHYVVDKEGHKRYFESDGKGSYHKNADGSPKLLPPLHHNNPKAQYLHQRLGKYLDSVQRENTRRRANGEPEIMPKVVVKSDFTTFGTDIVDGVFRDLMHPLKGHPELRRWHEKTGGKLDAGRFTGEATDREETKTGFRGDKKNYAGNQGHLWATTVSPAGKEGVDFGNAHYMLHFDQNWNPQKMAQFTARVRRADSHEKAHASVGRANAVRVESLHMPGTIEDFIFSAQDRKMADIKTVENNTRTAEESTKYGDSTPSTGRSARSFTRKGGRKAGRVPQNPLSVPKKAPKGPKVVPLTQPKSRTKPKTKGAERALVAKSFQYVILL